MNKDDDVAPVELLLKICDNLSDADCREGRFIPNSAMLLAHYIRTNDVDGAESRSPEDWADAIFGEQKGTVLLIIESDGDEKPKTNGKPQ